MKLSRIAAPFDNPDFVFELKHDGFRSLPTSFVLFWESFDSI